MDWWSSCKNRPSNRQQTSFIWLESRWAVGGFNLQVTRASYCCIFKSTVITCRCAVRTHGHSRAAQLIEKLWKKKTCRSCTFSDQSKMCPSIPLWMKHWSPTEVPGLQIILSEHKGTLWRSSDPGENHIILLFCQLKLNWMISIPS